MNASVTSKVFVDASNLNLRVSLKPSQPRL